MREKRTYIIMTEKQSVNQCVSLLLRKSVLMKHPAQTCQKIGVCVCVCVCVCVWFAGNRVGSPDLGMATAAAKAALPIPASVCRMRQCVRTMIVCLVSAGLGFLTCVRLVIHVYDCTRGLYGHRNLKSQH